MSFRFSTEAANADVLGEETPVNGQSAKERISIRPDSERAARERARAAEAGAGKPGKDINAPGFIKDQDAAKPS